MKTQAVKFNSASDFYKYFFPKSAEIIRINKLDTENFGHTLAYDILEGIKEQLSK